MKKITPFLWFNDKAEDAAEFYLSVSPEAKKGGRAALEWRGALARRKDSDHAVPLRSLRLLSSDVAKCVLFELPAPLTES